MKIDPDKEYGLLEIQRDGLLLKLNGQKHKSLVSIRHRLQLAGFFPQKASSNNRFGYFIKGSDLIKLNDYGTSEKSGHGFTAQPDCGLTHSHGKSRPGRN